MSSRKPLLAAALATAFALLTTDALAVGEGHAGFPNWAERVLLEWTNRARVDPQLEMTKCGAACGEGACYKPIEPVGWGEKANHAARFHSAEMQMQSFFAHDSKCNLVTNISTLFPTSCDGNEACACQASGSPTAWNARISLFGVNAQAEIIASGSDPNGAFYQWLYENSSSTTCGYSSSNGHRNSILTQKGAVGYGMQGPSVGDFGGTPETGKIPSGAHYPASGSVEFWANWYDPTGGAPKLALLNLNGTCTPMAKTRGLTDGNAAYMAKASVSGCQRYYFIFQDASGAQVTYPTTGSLGAGGGSCADWDTTRPASGAGCTCTPSCGTKKCGDNGCGGSCGACGASETCSAAGACVPTGPTCTAPKRSCGGACVDVQTDPSNCGDCGKSCAGTCTGGQCFAADGGPLPTDGGSDGGAGDGGAGDGGGGSDGATDSGLGCYGCTTSRADATPWLGLSLAVVALGATRARRRDRKRS
jgi:hypothetical protein